MPVHDHSSPVFSQGMLKFSSLFPIMVKSSIDPTFWPLLFNISAVSRTKNDAGVIEKDASVVDEQRVDGEACN